MVLIIMNAFVAGLIGGEKSKLNADTLDGKHYDSIYKKINKTNGSWDDLYSDVLFLRYETDVPGNSPIKILDNKGNQFFVINFIVGDIYGIQLAFTWFNRIAVRVRYRGSNGLGQWSDWSSL